MNHVLVSSSNIRSVGYENGTMQITFHSGGTYEYYNVPESIYEGLISAASVGSYFHQNIKDIYRYSKI